MKVKKTTFFQWGPLQKKIHNSLKHRIKLQNLEKEEKIVNSVKDPSGKNQQ